MKSFRVKEDEAKITAGTVVYKFIGYDYGCSSDDTDFFGEKYISITHDPNGGIPFRTMRENNLDIIEEK